MFWLQYKATLELGIYVGYDNCLQCLNDITKCYAQTNGPMLYSEGEPDLLLSETFIGTGYCVFFPMTAQELYAPLRISPGHL